MGLSIVAGFSMIKVMSIAGKTPPWLFAVSGIPILLILWCLAQVYGGAYRERGNLELLCRNTLLVNLSMAMILTVQQTLILSVSGR